MAAQVSPYARSGRFIRAYLLTWGLLAAGGLVYLASLAWSPDLLGPSQRQQVAEPDPSVQAATKALAEIGTVRRTVTEIQNDLGRLKSTIDERTAEERAAQARLAALEERVTTLATPPPEPAVTARQRTGADKRKTASETPRPTAHIITVTESPKAAPAPKGEEPAEAPKAAPSQEAPKIETGSIVPAAPTITFGEPEVTPVKQAFAVQLAAGPSLDALRLSWNLLRERHGAALASLQPRFVPPRAEGGPYRLLAGPLPSKADAEKVCADMGVGRKGCFSTGYIGQPL
jgi:sporulation related protein